jgi:uncharacterized glyoxalase superfamily protein PhnB
MGKTLQWNPGNWPGDPPRKDGANLRYAPQGSGNRWARVILRVRGVDALYQHLRAQGLHPSTPKNAEWGERYCEISDPDGVVISFADLLDAAH